MDEFLSIDLFFDDFTIVNAYTQYRWIGENNCDYDAIKNVFIKIKQLYSGKRIAYPMIGCGLAGGNWAIVSQIIDHVLFGEDHTLIIWDGK